MLISRTRPAPNQTNPAVTVTTNYGYDALHRLTSRSYTGDTTGTPTAGFDYDESLRWSQSLSNTIGRLSSESSGSTGQAFSYDLAGRVLSNWQFTPRVWTGTPYLLSYTYDLGGDLASSSNGVGVTFQYGYNSAQLLTSMTSSLVDAQHPGTLISGIHYNALGMETSELLGNGASSSMGFDGRLRLASVNTTSPTAVGATGSTGWVQVTGASDNFVPTPGAAEGGSVTIGGSEKSQTKTQQGRCTTDLDGNTTCTTITTTTYDSGTVTITVDGHPDSVPFGQNDDATSIATGLVNAINNDGAALVSAGLSGTTVLLTARSVGAFNYPLTASVSSGLGSFTATASGPTLTGGANPGQAWDQGTANLQFNGGTISAPYGQGSTAQTIASSLAGTLSGTGLVNATVSGTADNSTITLTSMQKGGNTNYGLSWLGVSSTAGMTPNFAGGTSANMSGGAGPQSATVYSMGLGYAGDDEVTSSNDSTNGDWSYSYDQFNRLASSSKSTAPVQGFSYAYDRYGNRWQQNLTAGTGPSPQYLMDNNTNRIDGSGITYDALGNVLTDSAGSSYTYDAENRLIKVVNSAGTYSYTYDAEGRRIRNADTEFLYDMAGRGITLLNATTGAWNYGEIYAGGRHLATYSGSTTNFLHTDWLGTKRVITSMAGQITQTCTSLPFGGGLSCTGTASSLNGFTDDVHDSESNLEHTWFRQLSTTQGRWMSTDQYLGSIDITNPQSMNRFAYVINNPINFFDPSGLDCLVYVQNEVWNDGWHPAGVEGLFCGDTGGAVGSAGAGGSSGGGTGDADPKPKQHSPAHDRCVKKAIVKANDIASEEISKNLSKPFKSLAEGFIGGGIIGCVVTLEGGCIEGAIPGALAGAFGGVLKGSAEALYEDIRASASAISEMKQDIAACPD